MPCGAVARHLGLRLRLGHPPTDLGFFSRQSFSLLVKLQQLGGRLLPMRLELAQPSAKFSLLLRKRDALLLKLDHLRVERLLLLDDSEKFVVSRGSDGGERLRVGFLKHKLRGWSFASFRKSVTNTYLALIAPLGRLRRYVGLGGFLKRRHRFIGFGHTLMWAAREVAIQVWFSAVTSVLKHVALLSWYR